MRILTGPVGEDKAADETAGPIMIGLSFNCVVEGTVYSFHVSRVCASKV